MEQGEAIQVDQSKSMAEQLEWRAWREGREEPSRETQWQDFLGGLDSPHTSWEKEPSPWEDAKAFLASFEQVAQACQWAREEWVARLLPALSGEAQQAFGSLEAGDRKDYGKVKLAILYREANRMETLRQHFRQFRSREVEDPRWIYSQLRELCCQWLRPERRSKEQILELLVLEQFLAILPPELQNWIRAGGPENCTQAAALVEDFLLSQQGAKAETQQEMSLGVLDAEGESLDPTQRQISQDAKQNSDEEISLPGCLEGNEKSCSRKSAPFTEEAGSPLTPIANGKVENPYLKTGHGTKHTSLSSLPLSPDRQEVDKGGVTEGQMDFKEMGVSLHIVEQTLIQPSQKTMFWQVLSEDDGKVHPSEGLLVPTSDLPFHLEKEEEMFAQLPEECERFPGKDLGNKKGSPFKVENPSHGGNKSGDPEMTQENMLVVAEIHEERYESKRGLRKQLLVEECESRVSPSVAVNGTLRVNTNRGRPLFSRYGQRYSLTSGLVTEQTRRNCNECSNSENQTLMNTGESLPEKSYKCPKRMRSFPEGVNLMRHCSSRMRERKNNCPKSRERFASKTVTRHQEIQHEQTSYKCPVCGKCMKRKQDVNRHLRIHTGEQPFNCPECCRRFSRMDNLSIHRRSHGRKMPYECPQCGKDFRKKISMVKHLRTHKCHEEI